MRALLPPDSAPMLRPAATALLGHTLWRARDQPASDHVRLSTGFAELNARIGGWPSGELTELLTRGPGHGRFSLLLPALADLTQSGRAVALLNPPNPIHPAALAQGGLHLDEVLIVRPQNALDSQWAAEELLRCRAYAALVMWLPKTARERELKRLKLAAEQGQSIGWLLRPSSAADQPSPAALRLRVDSLNGVPQVQVLKARGLNPAAPFALPAARPALVQWAQRYLVMSAHPSAILAEDSRALKGAAPAALVLADRFASASSRGA
jgi:protein ImuA